MFVDESKRRGAVEVADDDGRRVVRVVEGVVELLEPRGRNVLDVGAPAVAKCLLKHAIRDGDPVLFFEHKKLYRSLREPVPPTMATVRPSSSPLFWRMVSMSRRPWVGCSWRPSPALITDALVHCAMRCGAPAAPWRTTIASTPIASIVCTVSSRLSPFFTDEVDTAKFIVSADSRFAAVSNDSRVRVESS